MPTDHFAQLGQPRRPWLEPEALKAALHQLAAEHHPDKAGEGREFASINAAYAQLSDPAQRLRHLLELEAPETITDAQPIPAALADAFMRIATLRRAVDAFTQQQAGATTPLAQALLASERFALQRDVEAELAGLIAAQDRVVAAVREVDAAWDAQKTALAPRLHVLQQELLYVQKWTAQLREALFNLPSTG